MSNQPTRPIDPNQHSDLNQPMVYQIRLQGHLGPQWTEWFEGLTVRLTENGDTVLVGPVADQAVLHGLLRKIRDIGITLISVNPIPSNPAGPADNDPQIKKIRKIFTK